MIYLIISLAIVILIGGTIASIYYPYVFVKPYLKSLEGRKLILKGFLILALLSAAMYTLAFYLMREPAYFDQGIEQLHHTKYIKDKIGDFSSYTFYESKLTNEPASPAIFQVAINSDSTTLFLNCTMTKVKDKWKLVKIQEDSIVRKQ
jgi:hypothetical protein